MEYEGSDMRRRLTGRDEGRSQRELGVNKIPLIKEKTKNDAAAMSRKSKISTICSLFHSDTVNK